jgi:hypothetical protein
VEAQASFAASTLRPALADLATHDDWRLWDESLARYFWDSVALAQV